MMKVLNIVFFIFTLLYALNVESVQFQGFDLQIPIKLDMSEQQSEPAEGVVGNSFFPSIKLKLPSISTLMNSGGDMGVHLNWNPFNDVILPQDPDVKLSIEELVVKYGYKVELHKILTEDGYILGCHRISGKAEETVLPSKGPVYLQHGLFGSAADWLIVSAERALPFLLVDEGYDVWLANSRGNDYSKDHEYLDSDSLDFWKFSLNEMGYYDVPAVIDYILKKTKFSKLKYVGHSLGTTIFFMAICGRPEYNKKVEAMFALAPTAHLGNSASPLAIAKFIPDFMILQPQDMFFKGKYAPGVGPLSKIIHGMCSTMKIGSLCNNLLFVVTGYDGSYSNKTTLARIFMNTPQTTSARVIVHLLQLMRSPNFKTFDYGNMGNLRSYGYYDSPHFHLHDITVPVYAWYSNDDMLVRPSDAQKTLRELGNWKNRESANIEFGGFRHTDFLYHDKVKDLLFDKILEIFQQIHTPELLSSQILDESTTKEPV